MTYSELSSRAVNNRFAVVKFNLNMTPSGRSPISTNAATALATTVAFVSSIKSRNFSTKPPRSARRGSAAYSFATHIAAVLRTYGSRSLRQCRSGSVRASMTTDVGMYDMVLIASARIRGLRSVTSCFLVRDGAGLMISATHLEEMRDN